MSILRQLEPAAFNSKSGHTGRPAAVALSAPDGGGWPKLEWGCQRAEGEEKERERELRSVAPDSLALFHCILCQHFLADSPRPRTASGAAARWPQRAPCLAANAPSHSRASRAQSRTLCITTEAREPPIKRRNAHLASSELRAGEQTNPAAQLPPTHPSQVSIGSPAQSSRRNNEAGW